ncbi:MAG: hypothetical protein GX754_07465 [Clostridiaceae bacterium]|nr:hypothetical protein [Clostridiaceae bacterium]
MPLEFAVKVFLLVYKKKDGGRLLRGDLPVFDENIEFRSLQKGNMSFHEVYEEILKFISSDTGSSYKISVGTDSHAGPTTIFVSCILVHRVGKGAIGFLHKNEIPRKIKNLREKIYLETCASLQLAYLFNDEKMANIIKTVKSGGAFKGVTFEFHIDVGKNGPTKTLINEMVGMVKGLNFIPKIKPDSYCASCFADRYTKAI